jgi:hypothetical protein
VTALGARSEFVTVCVRFDDVILVKTGSLAVLLFLFFLLLGFNHFVEEGLAELVDVTHALSTFLSGTRRGYRRLEKKFAKKDFVKC